MLSKDDKNSTFWAGKLIITKEYYESLRDHSVPIPNEAIKILKESSLDLDILSFFAKRLYSLKKPLMISYQKFKDQFGHEYKLLRTFTENFKKSTRNVLKVYRDAKVEEVRGGLILKPSPPMVRSKTVFFISNQSIDKPVKDEVIIYPLLDEKTIKSFRELCPRLDVYACKDDFDCWLDAKQKGAPRFYQKAFLGFAEKWAKGKG